MLDHICKSKIKKKKQAMFSVLGHQSLQTSSNYRELVCLHASSCVSIVKT